MQSPLFRVLTFAALLTATCVHAVIFESNNITDILPYVEQDTLVIFDLDDTIFRTPSMLGNDAWFNYQVETKVQQGFSYNQATQETLPLYMIIQYFSQLEIVDPKTPAFIADLQNKNIKVMALSARSIGLMETTKYELLNLGVFFAKNPPATSEFSLGITHKAYYSDGILFGANNNKGTLLLQFFDDIQYHPNKVVFVDDKRSHLEAIESATQSRGITFVGLRYSAEDGRKASFDPGQAEQLLQEFKINLAIIPFKKTCTKEQGHDQTTPACATPA